MELSHLNSNKSKSILKAKFELSKRVDIPVNSSLSQPARLVNEYGEIEIKQYTNNNKYLTKQEIAEIAEAYSQGKTTYQLAEQYGCCRRTIVNALRKCGITATKAKAQEILDDDIVIKMYKEYRTTAEIAHEYGVNPNAVIKCLRDHGVKIRSRWDYPKK